jgi:fatty-acyl-CoA synthase
MFDAQLTTAIDRARRFGIGDLLWRSAARVPDKTALVYRGSRWSYAELDVRVNRCAHALAARGVSRGDRIALLSHNNDLFVVLYFALARLGAISVPINFMLTAGEVAYVLEHSGASGIVVEDALQHLAQDAIGKASPPSLNMRAVIDQGHVEQRTGWDIANVWMEGPDASPPDVPIDDDDCVQILYTSGTESRPKGAMMATRNLVAQYASCVVDGEMTGEDVEIHALPLYHCAQLHCFLTPSIYLGATNIILPGADAASILAAIEQEHVTKLFCPPTVWIALLRHPDFDRRDLSSLRKAYYGASVMPVEVLKELTGRLSRVRLFNFYGQTEMSPVATILRPEDQLRKLGSAGRPAMNVETMLVDAEDHPVRPGAVGEIVHRGPHVMLGYWNDSARTAEAFRNGWFHSGDLGIMDQDGYLTIVDRKKDMIKTGGENVASREVEEILYQHPAVAEVAVFGAPHPVWIEAVTAAVVVRANQTVTSDDLIRFCREHLAGFKTPKQIVLVDALPKNASGKILKRQLRDAQTAVLAANQA